jgi:hypothetical protein
MTNVEQTPILDIATCHTTREDSMKKTPLTIALLASTVALAACGGSDHPHRGGKADVIMPPASPSIHFKVNDANGNTLDLMIECGEKTTLKQCADVNEDVLDKVAKMRDEANR